MSENKDMQLSLNGETFSVLKEQFDAILGRTIKNMEQKGADEATITLKLSISLEEVNNPGAAQKDEEHMVKPTFKHDISSVMQVKSKASGSLVGDYQLVWDEDEGKYVMKRITNGQLDLFSVNADEEDGYPADGNDDDDSEGGGEEAADEQSPFGWLCQFAGKTLEITEAMGNYTVRTEDNRIVLTSASSEDNVFHCDAEILKKHLGHKLTCVAYGDDSIEQISIECEDCFETLYTLVRPDLREPDFAEDEEDTAPDEDDDNLLQEEVAETVEDAGEGDDPEGSDESVGDSKYSSVAPDTGYGYTMPEDNF